MHLDFNSFSDEAVHVAGFGGKDLCVLKPDDDDEDGTDRAFRNVGQ
jgi:hypothetical protein